MANIDRRSQGTPSPLRPAPEPSRKHGEAQFDTPPYLIVPGTSDAYTASTGQDSTVSIWTTRWWQWRQAFEQQISSNVTRYWALWRNFNQGPSPGPGQEWRDQTVIPQAFKEISTRVPRLVLGLWGLPEPFTVRGRGFFDERYEEQVRTLIQESLDTIGINDPSGELFMKRQIDALTYKEIVGHVFFKVRWRKEMQWLKTKIKQDNGRWSPIERLETFYDNVDIEWIPITRMAIDVHGNNRWRIEMIRTSLEALQREDEAYRKANDNQALYPGLSALEDSRMGTLTRESTDEPRDTEHWPLDDGGLVSNDPGETSVELWLCWDNALRTCTKIANRRVILDHGLSDTPTGLDPYVSIPSVPIPGRVYGDSIMNWTGPLYVRQTRLSRARMDETLLNMFNQYLYRNDSIGNTTWFWRPGGGLRIDNAMENRPISDNIYLVPRRPLPPEAYAEEQYNQRQSEAVAAADTIGQGAEATNKSRDVTAAEINQRILQGANRYQLEVLYLASVLKKPILQKTYDLLRQNLTTARIVRILDEAEGEPLDLQALERPVDISIGDPTMEATLAEKLQEIDRLVALAKGDSAFGPFIKHREVLIEMLKATRTLNKSSSRYVKTEQEVLNDPLRQQQQGAQQGPAPPPSQDAFQATAAGPGSPGPAGLAGPNGESAGGPQLPAGNGVETI